MAKKFRPRHARDANQKQPDVHEDPARSPAVLLQCALAAVVGWLIVWAFLDPQDAVSVFLGNALPQNLGWLFAGALAAGLVLFGRGFRFETKYLWVAMAALGWLCVVTLVAGMENNPRRAWFGFWQVMTIGCAYLAIRQLDWGSHSRTAICLICLSGCAAVSFQGLYQVLIGFPQARAEYEQDSQGVLKALQIDPSEGSPGRLRFESRLYSPEPYASYALANSLAVVLSGGLVFALWLIGKHLLAGSAKPPLLMACGLYLAAIVVCWFLTRSRTAYVAVALSAVATGAMVWWHSRFAKSSSSSGDDREAGDAGWIRGRTGKILLIFGLISGLSIIGAGAWLARNDRLVLSEAYKSLEFRLQYWESTIGMIADRPLLGVGLGNFQSHYPFYKLEQASEEVADPHNWVLDLMATVSLPVALFVIAWLAIRLLSKDRVDAPERVDNQGVDDQRISRWVIYGAVGGGVLTIAARALLLGQEPLVPAMVWVVSAAIASVLLGQSDETFVDRMGCRAAVVAMLLALLSSGSWQASGLSIPLVAWLALSGRNERDAYSSAIPLVVAGAGFACFLLLTWRPVTSSWLASQELEARANPTDAQLESMVGSDPWNSDLRRDAAQWYVRAAIAADSAVFATASERALEGLDDWLQRDRFRPSNWRQATEQALLLAESAKRKGLSDVQLLERALSYQQEAVNRYPTNVRSHAQLAAVAMVAGRVGLSQQAADEAYRLSEATPHADRKLPMQRVWLPPSYLPIELLPESSGGSVQAEPLLNLVRSNVTR